jgi:transcriptional regulator with XRE-family HTH domain
MLVAGPDETRGGGVQTRATVAELSEKLGAQVRELRIARNIDQAGLARLANISVGALANLEHGRNASLSTVVAVVRALGRTDWLGALAPTPTVSPMQLLRAKRPAEARRVRVRHSRAGGEG